MKRNAEVALTLPGDSNANRLRLPSFAVLSLRLVASGGQESKPYLPQGFPAPAGGGSDDFHFAPEKEKVKIAYEIDDPFGVITSAKLELFCRFKDKPLWSLDLARLGPDWIVHGKHEVEWDGRLPKAPEAPIAGTKSATGMSNKLTELEPVKDEDVHPDGFVTLEHTPYKLRLSVESEQLKGLPAVAWTHFHVLVKEIKLELGDKKMLPAAEAGKPDLDLKVYEDNDAEALNGSLPAEGGRKKVFLESNIFSLSCAEQFDDTDFEQYKALWGDGPRIPIVAVVKVRDSADNAVDAPKALGKVRFLWDVEDVAESEGSVHASHHATAKTFVEKATDYYKNATKPKGDNCHKDRGGKRGDASKHYFPKQDGYDAQDALKDRTFPFPVEPCKERKWAAYSRGWRTGALEGKTGVLFQPSRMAGDACKVTVYLAYDKKADDKVALDVTDDAPLKVAKAIKATTGTFEIWRRLHLRKYLKKTAAVTPDFPVATFQGYYEKAYVQVKDASGGAQAMSKAASGTEKGYDARVADALATTVASASQWYVAHMVSSTVASHYDAGAYAIEFNAYADFCNAVKADKGWDDAELATWLGTVLDTEAKYNGFCGNIATSLVTEIGKTYMHASDGINLFQFNQCYNLASRPGGQKLNGFAPGTPIARTRCMFVLCASPSSYSAATTHNRAEQTVAHEIGHCLFLAHSKDGVSATDACNKPDEDVHDPTWANCTMSYNYTAERKFCGFCLLRLRGWHRTALNKAAASNQHA